VFRAALKMQKRAMKELRAMFDTTSYFDSEQITHILMVTSYQALSACRPVIF